MTAPFRRAYTDHGFRDLLNNGLTSLADNFPFYPLESPGIPKAGPNFVREAVSLAGESQEYLPDNHETMRPMDLKRAQKTMRDEAYRLHLSKLYYQALYDNEFTVTVDLNGRFRSVPFILGHLWGFDADGPRQARVMVVGKSPGREEADEKRNFTGPTSLLFREILDELGFTNYWDWYVTNVCRFPSPRAHQTSSIAAAWINDCLPLLHEEIRLVQPEYLLLLGTEAISAVLGKGETYKSTNGRVNILKVPTHRVGEEPQYREVKVVTCLHPSAVVHDPAKRDDLYKALRYFKAVLYDSLSMLQDPEADCEHLVVHNAEQLNRLVNRLQDEGHKAFALDTEFDGDTPEDGKLHTVQFSWGEKKACMVNMRDEKGHVTFGGGFPAARRLLTKLLKGPDKRIIFHYAPADIWWLKHIGLGFIQDQFECPLDDPDPDGETRLFGWQKLATQGGFDTILAAHSHEETADLGLKELAVKHTTIGNYEVRLEAWKRQRARDLKCGVTELPGFGACPRNILNGEPVRETPYGVLVRGSYGGYDADGTFRLFNLYNYGANGRPALLDHDRFGLCSRVPFWTSMRACLAFYEMHETGIPVDVNRAEELYDLYTQVKEALLIEMRAALAWSDFNPSSPIQCKEYLFGVKYNGKIDRQTGMNISVRPEGALTLDLLPYKSTGKRPKLWEQVRAQNKEEEYTPAVDKETLEVYSRMNLHPTVQTLLDLRYIQQITRSVLQPPKMVKGDDGTFDFDLDEDGQRVYTRGLLSYKTRRGRVHTNFSQTKDTGRASSWQPPMQNISKKREPDYKRIAAAFYKYTLRSMFVVPPADFIVPEGYAIVTADYTGAELFLMAIQTGCAPMIDHCRRALLPDSGFNEAGEACTHGKGCKECGFPHPNYYDIHANVTVKAFQPRYPDGRPCREGRLARYDLKKAGLSHLRDAAKPVDFGYAYGMTADAAYRRAREGGADVTRDDSQALLDGLEALYPELPPYYASAAFRSHDPMHLTNCSGRRRRTYFTDDQKTQGDLERKFKNFPIQSGVADGMSTAMANFREYRKKHRHLRYKMCLQIHDDVVALVPISQVEEYYDVVVPYCMTEMVDIWPCDFDGNIRPDPQAPYHLVPDRHVYLRWGSSLTKEECRVKGLPERFANSGE
jgi:uracil-DNA glycosylase family 4